MNPAGPVVPYRPALFLGLGGTGKEVLLRLRRRFYERFRTYDLPFARFLWIDTDMRAVDARGEALKGEYSSVLFQDHERFPLMTTSVGQDLHDIFENPGRWKNIHEWLYESVSQYGRGVKDGAGGVRAIGRLTFFANYENLALAIAGRIQELASQETIQKTQAFFAEHLLPNVNAQGGVDPVVFVVSSVAGGTGCGTLLDTGFLLCDIKRHVHEISEMFAYVFLPNVYYKDVRAGELAPRSYANAYAALKEIDHYTKRIPQLGDDRISDFLVEWRPADRKKIAGPPFDATYLLEMANEADISISQENRKDLFSMLAECLFLDLLPGSFSDAKRSDYSNIVTQLAGAAGANMDTQGVRLTQMFSRRYASCGMSKIEIPVDTVRGACASKLSTEILDHILRDSEDANVGPSVRNDLAGARLDRSGIPDSFGSQWKENVRLGVAGVFQNASLKTPADVSALTAALDKLEKDLTGADADHVGDVVRWIRQRAGTVTSEAKARFKDLLRDRCLENPSRGLNATIRDGGYLDLAARGTKSLSEPPGEGQQSAFDAQIADTDRDAQTLKRRKAEQLHELASAVRSVPALMLQAREAAVRTIGARVKDAQEQYLLAVAEKYLLTESKKVAQEIYREMAKRRLDLRDFSGKADTIRAEAYKHHAEFVQSLERSSHVLFIRLFDMKKDWPVFYKLDIDAQTQQPMDVNPEREYHNLLAALGAPQGLMDVAQLLVGETVEQVARKVDVFCEGRFYEDFIRHERPVGLLDRPALQDPSQRRQTLQNLVNQARPMLRQSSTIGSSPVRAPRYAYLGICRPQSPEARTVIAEITALVSAIGGTHYQVDVHATDKPYEIYLYFSNYAFPLPALKIVNRDCHIAYTDFYTMLNETQAGTPAGSIPLHLSKTWEGKYDDLVIYSDEQAKTLVEVLSILQFGTLLKVISVAEKEGQVAYSYKPAPPLKDPIKIGNRRVAIARLMRDAQFRSELTTAAQSRENSLNKEQLVAYYWGLQACLNRPEVMPGLPEYTLLAGKLRGESGVYKRALGAGATEEALDTQAEQERFKWIRERTDLGLEWPLPDQPIIKTLTWWEKPD